MAHNRRGKLALLIHGHCRRQQDSFSLQEAGLLFPLSHPYVLGVGGIISAADPLVMVIEPVVNG